MMLTIPDEAGDGEGINIPLDHVAPALRPFINPDESGSPNQATLDWLLQRDVSPSAIGSPWAVRAGRAEFYKTGRYAPALLGKLALVFGILDHDGIVDAAAWCPQSGAIGTRLGVGACIGQGQIGRDELGTTGPAIPVHRDPVGWLRAGRVGVVIADSERAAHLLSGLLLAAEDEAHAQDLRQKLRVRPPSIVSRAAVRIAA